MFVVLLIESCVCVCGFILVICEGFGGVFCSNCLCMRKFKMEFTLKYLLILVMVMFPQFSGVSKKAIAPVVSIPDGLLFGAGTSAFQIEGAMNSHGRTESYVERFISNFESPLADKPDISCDSYHKYKDDIKILKYIGLDIYRFSMSWSRLLPTGHADYVNREAVNYYHALLDELEQANIQPVVQIVHFDHPATFEDFGGWQNETMIELFKDYARFIFTEYGHRVKYFLTFNEPNVFCTLFESRVLAINQDEKKSVFPGMYVCSSNILKAHAETYRMYHGEFNFDKKGMVSINLLCNNYIVESEKDRKLMDIAFAFGCGWFADPIFSNSGDYSDILKQRVKETNALRGKKELELPTFSESWVDKIRGSADFFSFSYYSARIAEDAPTDDPDSWITPVMPPEARLLLKPGYTWVPTINQNYIYPRGLRAVLNDIKVKYHNPPVFVVENGYADDGRLDDVDRIKFIYAHLKQLIDAINHDKCDVKSYIYWSLIDNFEFWDGYNSHFGLAQVDFTSPDRKRTPKQSATWLGDVLLKRELYIDE